MKKDLTIAIYVANVNLIILTRYTVSVLTPLAETFALV